MNSAGINILIAYLSELNQTGVTRTPNPVFDRALTAALNALDVPFHRAVSPGGYTIRLKEDEYAS